MIRLYRDPAINSEEKKHRMLNPTRRKKNGFELKTCTKRTEKPKKNQKQ